MDRKWGLRLIAIAVALWISKGLIGYIFNSTGLTTAPISRAGLGEQLNVKPQEWHVANRPGMHAQMRPIIPSRPAVIPPSAPTNTVAMESPAIKATITAPVVAGATKKEDPKKKKKKKKPAPISKQARTRTLSYRLPGERVAETPTDTSTSGGGAYSGAPAAAPAQENTELTAKTAKTVQDWTKLLLTPASFESVSKAVEYYRAGVINQSTFYGLIDHLTKGGADEKRYAVLAMESAPNSESFSRLAKLAGQESDPSLLAKIQESIRAYTNVRNLTYVTASVKDSDPYVRYYAILIIRESANQHASAKSPSTPTGRPARGYATTAIRYYDYFSPLLPLLEQQRAVESENRIVQELNNALAAVHDLISRQNTSTANAQLTAPTP